MATFWIAEVLFQKHGPRGGELVGTGLAWGLISIAVVIPAWAARRRAKQTDAALPLRA